MEIASILKDIEYQDKQPAIKVLLNTPAVKEIRISFKKGQEMKAHQAGYPIVVAVIEGCIDFGVDQQRYILDKGMLIALDANVSHDLKAEEDSIVRLSLNKLDSIERVQQVVK
ncbi:cupin [Pedobacter polaris]|uniref:Cupin n=1 Tax=Pedobacter polaris TaxID=2571273 RepID=A0A4U1CUA1_9SPHI|nr:cupin domain-containing protein [Pedobacter polaris]TKC12403.1 cupin [Pedobacter polaris]